MSIAVKDAAGATQTVETLPVLGQATMASSLPVVIASNQPAIPATDSVAQGKLDTIVAALASLLAELNAKTEPTDAQIVTGPLTDSQLRATAVSITGADVTASGSITTQNLVPTGTATANSAVEISTVGKGTVGLQVEGTYTGALSVQARVGASSLWVTLSGGSTLIKDTGVYSATVASAATGLYQFDVSAFTAIRVTALAAVTGTANINLRATDAVALVALDNPLPAGTAIIGALSANQSVNAAQMNGVAVTMGNGASGTGVQRAAIASDNTPSTLNGPTTAANSAVAVSNQSALSASGAVVKASAGNLYGVHIVNKDAALLFVHFHNQTTAPTRGSGIVDWYEVPASGSLLIPPSQMALLNFATGISIIAGTTAAGGSAPTTPPDVKVWYK